MRKKLLRLGGWIYSCGNGFLDDRWDPKKGPVKVNEKGELVYLGDVTCGVWSPFEILVPATGLNCGDIQDQPWMMKVKYRPLDWIRNNYDRGKEVTAEDRPEPFVDPASLWGVTAENAGRRNEGALVKELYVKPGADFPKGLFVTGANGVILQKSDYPYDEYSISHFKDVEIPGVFWGMATVEGGIWLQKLWNRTVSDLAEFNRTMARGKWLVPRKSRLEANPDDSHGQMLLYNPVLGHKPEMMTLKGLPATYMQILEVLARSFMELFHQHEVSMGTNRSDIRSGEMVALLQESDDFGNVPTHAVFEEALEETMRRVLQRIQTGYKEERILKIRGRDGQFEIKSFKGADLRNNTDVSIRKETSLPQSRLGRRAAILEKYRMGLYGPPTDPKVIKEVNVQLDEASVDLDSLYREERADLQNARIENEVMYENPGVSLPINSYDDHQAHLEEHRFARKTKNQELKREDYRRFLEVEVTLEVTFEEHMAQHQKMLAREVREQEARMARVLEFKKGEKR